MLLKAMNVGEILDVSLTLYKKQFKSYLSLVLILLPFQMTLNYLVITKTSQKNPDIGSIVAIGVSVLLTFLISIAVYGGLIKTASGQILDQTIGAREAFRYGFRKEGYVVLSGLLFAVAILIGALFLIVPGIYFSIIFVFFMQTVIIENQGPWHALKRSRDLVSGYWWRTFGVLFLIGLVTGVFNCIASLANPLIVLVLGKTMTAVIISNMIVQPLQNLVTPLTAIGYTVLYYDLKVRKENFDLHLMVDNLTQNSNSNL